MSCFLTGIIEFNKNRTDVDGKYSKEFDKCLRTIQKIGINEDLTILMGGSAPPYMFEDIKDCIPESLKDNKNTTNIVIVRSPEDNTSDDLFVEWEFEACNSAYIPGKARVFKELESFFNQVFSLNEVKSIWLRYQCMFACDVNKFDTIEELETKIYEKCYGVSFEISDFEIYKEKEKGTLLPEMTSSTEETDF